MKHFLTRCLVALLSVAIASSAYAQAYPTQNPTYIPTVVPATSTASTATGTAYTMVTQGVATATLRITGTCTSLAGTLQGSNNGGTTYTDLPLTPVAFAGDKVLSFSAAGFWRANVTGMNKIKVNLTALNASCTFALAGTQAALVDAKDPCMDSSIVRSSTPLNVSSSVTNAQIPGVVGKVIYVCNIATTASGTNPTITFKKGYSASTACDTAASSLTGAMVPTTTAGFMSFASGGVLFATSASDQFCATTGATSSFQGVIQYIQK